MPKLLNSLCLVAAASCFLLIAPAWAQNGLSDRPMDGPIAAGPIVPGDPLWIEFAHTGVGTPSTGCFPADPAGPACSPSSGGNSQFGDAPPWTFSGLGTVTVVDAFLIGEQFEVFDFGVSLGVTSTPGTGSCGNDPEPCLADPDASSGNFCVGPGAHSITIVPTVTVLPGAAYFRVTNQPRVTVYEDSGTDFQQALTNLGVQNSYRGSDETAFLADLACEQYHSAIIHQANFFALDNDLTAIAAFLSSGGSLLFTNFSVNFNPSHPLWNLMGGIWQLDLQTPLGQIQPYDFSHPIFRYPNLITGPLTSSADVFFDNGDFMSPAFFAAALAGPVGGLDSQSVIIVRDDNRAILNTFMPGDYAGEPDLIPLLENEISLILQIFADGFESGDTSAWSMTVP